MSVYFNFWTGEECQRKYTKKAGFYTSAVWPFACDMKDMLKTHILMWFRVALLLLTPASEHQGNSKFVLDTLVFLPQKIGLFGTLFKNNIFVSTLN